LTGLPKKYAKMGFKEGWRAFKASKKKRRSNPQKTTKRKVRRMARRKSRRRRKTTIPVALVVGASAGAIEPITKLVQGASPYDVASWILAHYTGYKTWDSSFDINELAKGMLPLVAGAFVHKLVGGTLGVNRALGQAGVPFLRI